MSRPSSLPCGASLLWYAANAVVALALCEWLLRREGEAVTAARYLASGVVLIGALWLFIFVTGPWEGIVFSFAFLLAGLGAYAVFARR